MYNFINSKIIENKIREQLNKDENLTGVDFLFRSNELIINSFPDKENRILMLSSVSGLKPEEFEDKYQNLSFYSLSRKIVKIKEVTEKISKSEIEVNINFKNCLKVLSNLEVPLEKSITTEDRMFENKVNKLFRTVSTGFEFDNSKFQYNIDNKIIEITNISDTMLTWFVNENRKINKKDILDFLNVHIQELSTLYLVLQSSVGTEMYFKIRKYPEADKIKKLFKKRISINTTMIEKNINNSLKAQLIDSIWDES